MFPNRLQTTIAGDFLKQRMHFGYSFPGRQKSVLFHGPFHALRSLLWVSHRNSPLLVSSPSILNFPGADGTLKILPLSAAETHEWSEMRVTMDPSLRGQTSLPLAHGWNQATHSEVFTISILLYLAGGAFNLIFNY